METAQDIIVAVQKLAKKLESLEATLINDCGYYQSTLEQLESNLPTTELLCFPKNDEKKGISQRSHQ